MADAAVTIATAGRVGDNDWFVHGCLPFCTMVKTRGFSPCCSVSSLSIDLVDDFFIKKLFGLFRADAAEFAITHAHGNAFGTGVHAESADNIHQTFEFFFFNQTE